MRVMAQSVGLLLLRVCVGSVLIHHGYDKLADIQGFADSVVKPFICPFLFFWPTSPLTPRLLEVGS